jgi:hypothetical protein
MAVQRYLDHLHTPVPTTLHIEFHQYIQDIHMHAPSDLTRDFMKRCVRAASVNSCVSLAEVLLGAYLINEGVIVNPVHTADNTPETNAPVVGAAPAALDNDKKNYEC